MIPDTPIQLAPVSIGPAPDGFQWAVLPDEGWQLLEEPDTVRRCRFGRPSCRAPSVARFRRGRSWWHYCADHLYGRWILGGRVVAWKLRELSSS